jgi:hypothetical protein
VTGLRLLLSRRGTKSTARRLYNKTFAGCLRRHRRRYDYGGQLHSGGRIGHLFVCRPNSPQDFPLFPLFSIFSITNRHQRSSLLSVPHPLHYSFPLSRKHLPPRPVANFYISVAPFILTVRWTKCGTQSCASLGRILPAISLLQRHVVPSSCANSSLPLTTPAIDVLATLARGLNEG